MIRFPVRKNVFCICYHSICDYVNFFKERSIQDFVLVSKRGLFLFFLQVLTRSWALLCITELILVLVFSVHTMVKWIYLTPKFVLFSKCASFTNVINPGKT